MISDKVFKQWSDEVACLAVTQTMFTSDEKTTVLCLK